MIIAEVIKLLGTTLAAVSAIAGAYLDGTKSVESGKLTRKGRIVVSAAIAGVMVSGFTQIAQMIDAQNSAEAIQQRNEQTAARLERIPNLIARQSFPLEPLELFFSIEYSMDQPGLASYSERLRKEIVSFLKAGRKNRRQTSEDLAGEDVLFMVTHNERWKPGDTDEERAALSLLEDNTSFQFVDPKNESSPVLKLLSAFPSIQDVIVTMKRHGDIEQKIDLQADFKRRVFIKKVWCNNPLRMGSDVVTFSALDLIGKKMTWKAGVENDLRWALSSFGLRFSYDFGFRQNFEQLPVGRRISIGKSNYVIITRGNVGLTSL